MHFGRALLFWLGPLNIPTLLLVTLRPPLLLEKEEEEVGATHFLQKMEVNYGSSFGGGTGSKTDLGMPAGATAALLVLLVGKKPLWKSTISF